jgi:hypothetical protein
VVAVAIIGLVVRNSDTSSGEQVEPALESTAQPPP